MKLVHIFLFVVTAVFVTACDSKDNSDKQPVSATDKKESAVEHARKHLDPRYVCPMHPQIIRDEPGSCPICGMDLVLKEAEEASSTERKILFYKHPHNPTITSDKPMKDEMGMDYVPVYDDGGGVSVKISPAVENNMGVRTAQALRDKLWRRIDTVGYVDLDENKISHIHIRTQGWIEKLLVKSEGERVQKGDLLFELYSPELVRSQDEHLQLIRRGIQASLVHSSRERLVALGMSRSQISEIERKGKVSQYVKAYAPQDGIISSLKVRQGMYVMPRNEIMTLADLSSIWMLAEVFESQAEWVKVGNYADVKLSYQPGREWEGKVEYIYPSLNPKTRTLKVRLRFDNPDEVLKPNMFADVTIYGGARKNIIIIPREALIRTGKEERVILAMGEGRYQPRNVRAGIESGDWVEIIEGLREGETVVTSGQFLIDSEASLKASLQRMMDTSGEQDHSMHQMEQQKIMGKGILREVLPAENKVNMTHEPIPSIGWPDMTMYFKVKPGVTLDDFKPEQTVEFELEQGDDGYVIKSMQAVK